ERGASLKAFQQICILCSRYRLQEYTGNNQWKFSQDEKYLILPLKRRNHIILEHDTILLPHNPVMEGHGKKKGKKSSSIYVAACHKRIVERHPSKAKITNLELAVAVSQNVLGLEVPVEDTCGVDVLHASEQLVEEELVVLGREVVVGLDDLVEVGLHELEDDVDVAELAARGREHDVLDLDDVRVAQQAEQLDLAEDAGGVGDVLEDVVDLLDGDALAGAGVDGGGDDAVAALADHLGDLVPARLAIVREERRLPGALVTP
ncbi:hypothetical protein U9M48_018260, partial [Paspalum notatum var. saurae]